MPPPLPLLAPLPAVVLHRLTRALRSEMQTGNTGEYGHRIGPGEGGGAREGKGQRCFRAARLLQHAMPRARPLVWMVMV